jgi:hypothetical protein
MPNKMTAVYYVVDPEFNSVWAIGGFDVTNGSVEKSYFARDDPAGVYIPPFRSQA